MKNLNTLFTILVGLSCSPSFALNCNDFATGTTVEDHFSSGKIKKLQSLEPLPSEYGDSTPMPTVLVKKTAVKSEEVAKLSLEIFLTFQKKKQSFNKFIVVTEWSDNKDYYFFKDYDSEKLNQAVFASHGASKIELLIKLENNIVCKKELHVDNH